MTLSMTAFARKERRGDWGELVWELRSVNHRFLETSLRLPEDLRTMETWVRERVGAALSRGKVDCGLRFKPGHAWQSAGQVDRELAQRVIAAANQVAELLGGGERPTPLQVLQWPGVFESDRPDMAPVVEAARDLLQESLQELIEVRKREGEKLAELIALRCRAMRQQILLVKERLPQVMTEFRQRLQDRLAELASGLEPSRLEQEVLLLLQRLDVQEEMDRLLGHLEEVDAVLQRKEPVGRRLDFLMQELNREANTLSSKSPDLQLTQAAVEMKVLIEQMREQVQNIE